jgi:SAM-dependent methyltransferase
MDLTAGNMDLTTVSAYDLSAADFARQWHSQPPPDDMYAMIRRFFAAGGRTADIGCGTGRDVAWMTANGYPASGYDPSEGLLAQARTRYPGLAFGTAALPHLVGIADASFDNVVCETVLMHLPRDGIAPSVRRLVAVLRPGGCLYLSWRVTAGLDQRDAQGRLYAAFEPGLITDALTGATILFDEQVTSASSGRTIHRIVARKRTRGSPVKR